MNSKEKLQKEKDYQIGSGARLTCAKFTPNASIIAAGDDSNIVTFWKVSNTKPKLTLTTQTTPSQCLTFREDGSRFYSGTQGGTVHVWDLATATEVIKFRGHLSTCTALCSGPNMLVTGSQDTKIKLWDERSEQVVQTFRGHTGKISSLALSPDASIIASGGADGMLKIWDISTGQIIQTFEQGNSEVTCLEFNPACQTCANGSSDKTVRYWDLEKFERISQTPYDTSGVQKIAFSQENCEHLFGVSKDNLTLWNIETNKKLDCVRIPPKHIADFKIAQTKNFMLLSLLQENTLSIHYSQLDNFNTDDSVDHIPSNQAVTQQEIADINNQIRQVEKNLERNTDTINKKTKQQSSKSEMIKRDPVPQVQHSKIQKMAEAAPANNPYEDQPMDNLKATYVQKPVSKPSGLDFANFVKEPQQDNSQKELEIINEVMQQHTTVVGVVQRRIQQIGVIMKWWNKNDIPSAINALNLMQDMSVTMDVLNNTFAEGYRVEQLNYDNIAQIVPHTISLINSKYETHILAGLKSVINIVKHHGPQIIQLKNFPAGRQVDLAREEKIQKADKCIEQFIEVAKSKGYQKSLTRKGDICEAAHVLDNHLKMFLVKARSEDQPMAE